MNSISPPVSLLQVFRHHHQPNSILCEDVVKPFVELVLLILEGRTWARDGEEGSEVTTGDLIWFAPGDPVALSSPGRIVIAQRSK